MLELDLRYNRWVMASNTHCSLFSISLLCILTCITWKLQVIHVHMDALHIERLLYYRKYSLCALELHERSYWRAKAPDMHRSFSDTALHVYTANLYIHVHVHHYLVHNSAWQQNSHTLWLHTTHQMMASQPTAYHFIRAKLASYTTRCSIFSINSAR